MQVLSSRFLERVGRPVINIHHSLLPAFPGAHAYTRARDRGVKLIGAAAHYVTEELDAGPIVEQRAARVSPDDDTRSRISALIYTAALSRAVGLRAALP
jgi:formyltetrahydrofolate deformylase